MATSWDIPTHATIYDATGVVVTTVPVNAGTHDRLTDAWTFTWPDLPVGQYEVRLDTGETRRVTVEPNF